MKKVFELVEKVAGKDVTVLVCGRTAPARRPSPDSSINTVRAAKGSSWPPTAGP